MSNKHAYLIMAHHKFEILAELIKDIDDERNDIYLHVDKHSKDFNPNEFQALVTKANLYIIPDRINVHWGAFSQIQCELKLLEIATKEQHSYYHLLVGVEFPIKSQDYIHKFFDENYRYEFIGFTDNPINISQIKHYHPISNIVRANRNIIGKIFYLEEVINNLLSVNRLKDYSGTIKKGYANWSITHDLALYILSHRDEINKRYKHTICADEIFIHTLVYNSQFWDKIYDKGDEYNSCLRLTTWDNKYNRLYLSDLNLILTSGKLFARKIDGDDAMDLIKAIKENRK